MSALPETLSEVIRPAWIGHSLEELLLDLGFVKNPRRNESAEKKDLLFEQVFLSDATLKRFEHEPQPAEKPPFHLIRCIGVEEMPELRNGMDLPQIYQWLNEQKLRPGRILSALKLLAVHLKAHRAEFRNLSFITPGSIYFDGGRFHIPTVSLAPRMISIQPSQSPLFGPNSRFFVHPL